MPKASIAPRGKTSSSTGRSAILVSALAVLTAALAIGRVGRAAALDWKGHSWTLTAGGMAGVCQGSAANVSIDSDGYLHMKITNTGGTWTGAEIFTTDKIGFGTYQWQIDGPVDKLDKNVVVGLYPYGPEAGIGSDGQNEIDIEYARWGNASYPNGNYTVYPPTGTGSSETTFDFTLTGTYTTSRFTWSSTKIDFATLSGFQPLGSTTGLIKTWTFSPSTPATGVPQQALPLGMNLWCFEGPPSNGQNVEIIVRDFTFVPLGAAIDAGPDDGGKVSDADGTDAMGDSPGRAGEVGTDATAGYGETAGSTVTGGTSGTSGGVGGTIGVGGSAATGGAIATGGRAGSAGNPTSGATGIAGAGGSDEVSTGGTTGVGGSEAAGGVPGIAGSVGTTARAGTGGITGGYGAAAKGSNGCGCSTGERRGAINGQTLIALVLMLFIVRRQTSLRSKERARL